MSAHVARELEQLLRMEEGALGFLEFADQQVVLQLDASVREYLEEQSRALDTAITDAGQRLPLGLAGLTTGILA